MDFQPGVTFSHYRIVEKLGRPRDAADEAARRRLVREARTAFQLDHPHIGTIHEVGEADGLVYMAMECVEGTLRSDPRFPPLLHRIGLR